MKVRVRLKVKVRIGLGMGLVSHCYLGLELVSGFGVRLCLVRLRLWVKLV